MSREDFSFTSGDGIEIACYRWRAPARPLGIVQVAHGMGEHALRYARVAEVLCGAGFHVYANDHRGHGRSAKSPDSLGDFGSGGWNSLVDDMVALTRLARAQEAGAPVVLLGHSMGSFAAQQFLLDHSELIAGAVLSGSVSVDRLTIDPSRRLDLSSLNYGIEKPRTPFDWLTRDPAVVDAYIADRLCGFSVNARANGTMAARFRRLSDPAGIGRIRAKFPIYILAGDCDPINHELEWLRPLAERYRAAGLLVTEAYYSGGRHEMLNEVNRDQVLSDLLNWLRRVAAA